MTTPDQLFDEAVRYEGRGKRLPDDASQRLIQLLPKTKQLIDRNIASFRQNVPAIRPLPQIIFDYIDSPEPDACAILYNNQYFIALSYGLLLNLKFMFNYLLSVRDVLPYLGDIVNELSGLRKIPFSLNYDTNVASIQAYGLTIDDFVPKDPVRKDVADLMLFISVYFKARTNLDTFKRSS